MKNLRLRTRMGLLLAVLVLTAGGIAATGYVQLHSVNLRLRHMVEQTDRANQTAAQIRIDLLNCLRLERQAVISEDDDESRRFTREAREIAQRISHMQQELAAILESDPDPDHRRYFGESVKYWRRYQDVHDKVLALGEMNTNAKAQTLLREQVGPQADAVVEPLTKLADLTDQEFRAAVAAKDVP